MCLYIELLIRNKLIYVVYFNRCRRVGGMGVLEGRFGVGGKSKVSCKGVVF